MTSLRLSRKRTTSLRGNENLMGWLLASPWILGFVVFTAGPMIFSIFLGLTKWDMMTPPEWVGLDNFAKLFADLLVRQALLVTSIYAVVSVPLHLGVGLLLALMLNQDIRGIAFWRTVYYLPSVISGVAVSMLWMWVLNRDFGVLNWLLWEMFNIQGPAWLSSETWALPALILMSLWGVGGSMIINLAGLQSIPTELYEAARIDGANGLQQFRAVTLPLMSPVLFYNLIIGMIAAIQTFTPAYVMTNGGPNNATLFLMLYLYWNAFQWLKMGYASALAWMLFIYILGLTLLVLKSSSIWVFYQGEVRNR